MKQALTFDDVLIVPAYSEVGSRLDPDTTSMGLDVPLLSANMDTVTGPDMAIAMDAAGGMGVLHRFMPKDMLLDAIAQIRGHTPDVAVSVGIGKSAKRFVDWCDVLIYAGVTTLVLDVAHGHQKRVIECLMEYGDRHATMIAGNVATREAVEDLLEAGADWVKVGIGPGSACTTRTVTGIGVPQFTAIHNCRDLPIIADGGVKTTADFVKAVAAGADAVMCGSLFAGCTESPGELSETDTGLRKQFRGSSSSEAREEFGLTERIAEGVSGSVPFAGLVADTMQVYQTALQSAMSYVGARSVEELQAKAEFVRVTPSSIHESGPRI